MGPLEVCTAIVVVLQLVGFGMHAVKTGSDSEKTRIDGCAGVIVNATLGISGALCLLYELGAL